jgi:hypothetical protein
MLELLARLWDDPVWSKVIAAAVLAVIGSIFAWVGNVFNWWAAGLQRIICWLGMKYRPAPNIRVVDIVIPDQNPALRLTFPLKCYVTMQNNSTECADVRVSEYRPRTVTLKQFVLDVLQVQLREWCPRDNGVDRVAVLPHQLFRAWIGIDESRFNEERVRALRGQIGTIVLSVDGVVISVEL